MKTLSLHSHYNRYLCICFCLCLAFVASSTLSAQVKFHDYWMVEEYLNAFPEQQAITEEFNLRVQGQAKPLAIKSNPINILMVYPGLQASDYWRRSVSAFKHRLDQLGIPYQLTSHFTKPGTDLNLQSELIGKTLKQKPDYLVFTLDAMKHQKLIGHVMSQGHTKVILQNITTPLKAFQSHQPFLYVGFDHSIGTQLLIQEYQSRFPEGGNYAILFGTQGYVSKIRGGVFEAAMSPKMDFYLQDSYYVNFDRQLAADATMELIANHTSEVGNLDLDFIYAASTDIALGVLDTLKQHGLKKRVVVNGWGGGSAELDSIRQGELDFTVMRMNDDNGVAMAEAIALDLEGKTDQVPTIYSGSFRLVDQQTDENQLQRFEARAFRYSNNK